MNERFARLRIVSDGTGLGTRFFDVETGAEVQLNGVTDLRIEIGVDSLVRVHLCFDAVPIDMRALVTSAETRVTHDEARRERKAIKSTAAGVAAASQPESRERTSYMLKITISTKNPDGSPASSYTSTQVSGETPLGAITRTMREAADAFESDGFEAANQLAVEVATV